MNKRTTIGIGIAIIVLIALVAGLWAYNRKINERTQKEIEVVEDKMNTRKWKTYENSKYKFKFKYPNEFVLTENYAINYFSTQFNYKSKEGALMLNIYLEENNKPSLEERKIKNKEIQGATVAVQEYDLNGIPAIKTEFRGEKSAAPTDEIYCLRDNKKYVLNFLQENTSDTLEYQQKILSTFEFIE